MPKDVIIRYADNETEHEFNARLAIEYRGIWSALRWQRIIAGDAMPRDDDRFDLMLIWSLAR